jgi:hypothetical protein
MSVSVCDTHIFMPDSQTSLRCSSVDIVKSPNVKEWEAVSTKPKIQCHAWIEVNPMIGETYFLGGLRKGLTSETRVLDPKPKLLDFHMSGPFTYHYVPNKETVIVKDRERGFITLPGTCCGKKQSPSAYLWGTDMSFSFKL